MAISHKLLGWCLGALLAAGLGGAPEKAQAQDYFEGKTITIFAGRPPGGGVDAEARFVTEYLGKFVAGNPTVLPQNMPGAGGVVLGNYLAYQAEPDGLELGVPGRTSFILSPITGNEQARYKLDELSWIGTAARSNFKLWLRADLGITTFDQLMASKDKIIIGGSSGRNSDTIIPMILQEAGVPLEIIAGYPGTAEQRLALERGELDGYVTAAASFPADFLAEGKVVPVLQTFSEDPDVPTFKDVVSDPLAKSVLTLIEAPLEIGLALIGPPNMEEAALEALRDGYMKMVTSQEYVDAAVQRGFDAGAENARSGADLEAYVKEVMAQVNDEVVAKYQTYTTE